MSDFVYFIRPVGMDGPVKIGWSINPPRRHKELTTWAAFPLEIAAVIPGGFALEQKIQNCFFDIHSHAEWFKADPRLTALIVALQNGEPIETALDLNKPLGSMRKHWNRTPWTEGRKVQMHWSTRVHAAKRRAERARGEEVWVPSEVWLAMPNNEVPPTSADIATMEAFIADPVRLSQTADEKFPDGLPPHILAMRAALAEAKSA